MTKKDELFEEAKRRVDAGQNPVIHDLEVWAEGKNYEFTFEQYADAIELAYDKKRQGGLEALAAHLGV